MQNLKETVKMNPFPGLRPFSPDESHLFFGREGQSETILEYLSKYRFAAITGASGSGKSSLIYCGVIPLLYGGFIDNAGSTWRIITTRPGNTPVFNLAAAIANLEIELTGVDEGNTPEYYYSVLKRHSKGLVDAVGQLDISDDDNILIVIDQFEELFRFKEGNNQEQQIDESESLIKLLVNAVRDSQYPIYIILTMRSDFIGDCSDYQDLTALINQSNYLVPQMTRSDYENVITGPIKVAGAEIEPRLLQHLLNSIDRSRDQLPVLQHAMMRTWEFWTRHNNPDTPLSMRDYMAAGKLENALSLHANEAYNQLNQKDKQLCRIIFQSLTERGKEGKGIRRPVAISEVAHAAQCQPIDVIRIVEIFREPGRSFVTPSIETALNEDTYIDLSHESLMRIWDKLKIWVDDEASSSQMYLRLVKLAGLYQLGKTGLMRPPDLHLAIGWRKKQNPNRAWAKRYNPAFEKAMVFLTSSEKKYVQEEENKIKVQKRELHRTRRVAIFLGVIAVAFLGLMFYAYSLSQKANYQKSLIEDYAKVLEAQKDTAVHVSQMKEYERIQAVNAKDSLEKMSMITLGQKEVETQQVYQLIMEAERRTEELEKSAAQIEQERIEAQNQAKLAQKIISQAEVEKMSEQRKRMITLSHSLSIKSGQIDDNQLAALLAYHAYVINRENGGQAEHPDIYRGLYLALRSMKGSKFNSLAGHRGWVEDLVFDPSRNILYSADNLGTINKWGFRSNNPRPIPVITNDSPNTSIAITIDGRWMACGTESGKVKLLNTTQPTQSPREFDAHEGKVLDVRFIPGKNAMVTSGSDNKVKLWDLLTNESLMILQDVTGINDIDVSPSGNKVICVSNNGRLLEYNVKTGNSVIRYSHNASIFSVDFDYEGEKIALGDKNGNLLILNSRTGGVIKRIKAHSGRIADLDYSPDNRSLATTSLDGTIKIWNVNNWSNLPIEIKEHDSWVESIAFSPDGKKLLSSNNNGSLIYIWPVKTDNMVSEICNYLSRQLTLEEWKKYIGIDLPYREVCK